MKEVKTMEVSLRNVLSTEAMEGMIELRNSQPSEERLHYFDVALEGTAESNATLLQKLYQDIISKSAIDFGQIPDSQGKLIKFKDYKIMSEAMECINKLFNGVESKEVDMMNRLHDQIITLQKDFAFGYQFDIDIIKIVYCTSVMSLMDMINLCICAFTQYMRNQSNVLIGFTKVKKKDLAIIQTVNSLLKSYESGEWNRLMNTLKKDPSMRAVSPATEGLSEDIKIAGDLITKAGGTVKNIVGGTAFNWLKKFPQTAGGKVTIIVAALIMLFFAVRKGIYYFFHGRKKVSDWMKNEKEFLKACHDTEINNGSESITTEKKQKLAARLERLSDKIAVSTVSANSDAIKSMTKENRNSFSTASLKMDANPESGITF